MPKKGEKAKGGAGLGDVKVIMKDAWELIKEDDGRWIFIRRMRGEEPEETL